MAASVHNRLKQCLADTWTVREKLCLASAVTRSGDQNWAAVSRTMRLLTTESDRPPDWYSTKNCAVQYDKLLEQVDVPKRKREKGESNLHETLGETLTKMLSQKRIEELEGILEEERATYEQLRREVQLLESNQCDNRLHQFWDEIMREQEKEEDEEKKCHEWLKERDESNKLFQATTKQQPVRGQVTSPQKLLQIKDTEKTEHKKQESFSEDSSDIESVDEMDADSKIMQAKRSRFPYTFSMNTNSSFSEGNNKAVEMENCSGSQVVDAEEKNEVTSKENENGNVNDASCTQLTSETHFVSTTDTLPDDYYTPVAEEAVEESSLDGSGSVSQSITNLDESTNEGIFDKEQRTETAFPDEEDPHYEKDAEKVVAVCEKWQNPECIAVNLTETSLEQKNYQSELKFKQADSETGHLTSVKDTDVKLHRIKDSPLKKERSPAKTASEIKEHELVKKIEERDISQKRCQWQTLLSAGSTLNEEDTTPVKNILEYTEKPTVYESRSKLDVQSEGSDDNQKSEYEREAFENQDVKDENEEDDSHLLTRKWKKKHLFVSSPKEEEQKESLEKSTIKKEILDNKVQYTSISRNDISKLEKETRFETERKEADLRKGDFETKTGTKLPDKASDIPSDDLLIERLVHGDNKGKTEQDEKNNLKKEVKDEYEFDDDISRDSTDVKDFMMNRPDRRRLSLGEGISSPVISESTPSSPASTSYGDEPDAEKQHRAWKRSIMLIWNDIAAHKYASIFLRPITEDKVPGYHSIVYRPVDLLTIKRNIESGHTRSTSDFLHDVMLMFFNAKMYNTQDHDIYSMADEMMRDAVEIIEDFIHAQVLAKVAETPQKSLRRETRESSAKRVEDRKREEREEKPMKRRKL